MGRFSAEKQFSLLISSFARLAAAHSDWDLWIWGDGPLRPDLLRQATEIGLAGRVVFPGTTTEPWVELAASDAFVLSSAFEGFPNALLEAMAVGLPCVAFDCPSGPREISRDGQDALLVPSGDGAALVDALARLMRDPSLRRDLGARGSVSVRERYALEAVLSTWDRLFAMAMPVSGHAT